MNEQEFIELKLEEEKAKNKYFILPFILLIGVFISLWSREITSEFFNVSEKLSISILFLFVLILSSVILLVIDNQFRKVSSKIDDWLVANYQGLLSEAVSHEYKIVDFVYLHNNNAPKTKSYQTKSFDHQTTLVEITYLKDNKKYKMVVNSSVLNDSPKKMKYIEFKDSKFYKANVIYNLICE